MQRKRWNVFQTSKSDGNRTKKTTIFFFFLVLTLTWWQISMWLSLSPNLIFVDLAFKCALHFHLDFCLQTIFLPVSVRYTSWSHQSIYDAPSLSKYDKSLLLCSWKRPWAIWGDSCNLIGHPNGQDGPILLGWDRSSWSRARKRLRGADLPSSWFFYNVGNEVAKQRRKNKTFKESHGFTIVLQIQFGFFPGSRNKQKQVILDSYYMKNFSLYKQSVNDQACSVKIAGYWHNFFFCAFMDHDFASVH